MKVLLCLSVLAMAPCLFGQDDGPQITKLFATCEKISAIPGLPQGTCPGPYMAVLFLTSNPAAVGFDVMVTTATQTQTQLVRAFPSNGFHTGLYFFGGMTEDQAPVVKATVVVDSGSTATN